MNNQTINKDDPVKLIKYKILYYYNLLSKNELDNIVRFGKNFQLVISYINKTIEESGQYKLLQVIKFVKKNLPGQLINYRIEQKKDVLKFQLFLSEFDQNAYDEIWICKTYIDEKIFSVAGRILFSDATFPKAQIIEQLWKKSPRLIEEYPYEIDFDYARLYRESWGYKWKLEDYYIFNKNKDFSLIKNELSRSLILIESIKDKMIIFCNKLIGLSISTFSLEYKITKNRIEIIDWDTPNDLTVIKNFI